MGGEWERGRKREAQRGTENIENGRGIAWGLGEAARGCEEAQIRNWERKKGGRKDLSRRPEEAGIGRRQRSLEKQEMGEMARSERGREQERHR